MGEKYPSWHKKYPWYSKYLLFTCAAVCLIFGIDAVTAAMRSDSLGATRSGAFVLSYGVLLWIYRRGEPQTNRIAWFVFIGLSLVAIAASVYDWLT